jgi:ribosomal protein S18 acetylase RimI-like enzyme
MDAGDAGRAAPSAERNTVRPMRAGDAADVARLTTQLGYPTTEQQSARRMAGLLDDPEQALFVADDASGVVVGWVHVRVLRLLELESTAQIAGIVVDEACRGAGVGRALMAAAERWAAGRGCEEVLLYSNAARDDAHRFYERLDYRRAKTSYRFHKRLAEEGAREVGRTDGAGSGRTAGTSDDE